MRPITEIIIHTTATKPNFMPGKSTRIRVDEVRRWHMQGNGWSDIGYHFLIDRDGTEAVGRPIERVGAHVKGHNTGTIGISLFGGHGSAATDQFSDNFTVAQDKAIRALIKRLRVQHPTITKVSGHNQYANKACPGFTVDHWYVSAPARTPLYLGAKPKPAPTRWFAAIISLFASLGRNAK